MKIGLYGGMANNMYVLAKALAAAGADVRYVIDRGDPYPMSQPLWEDVRLTLPHAEVAQPWTLERIAALERRAGWERPAWVVDPLELGGAGLRPLRSWLARGAARVYLGRGDRGYLARAARALRGCDVLIVCGPEPEVLAATLGRPYVIFIHGGDCVLAAGMARKPERPAARARYELWYRAVRAAFHRAAWIGTMDPKGIGGPHGDLIHRLPRCDFRPLPLPYTVQARAPRAAREGRLQELLAELGLSAPEGPLKVLVPSRLDFAVKGQHHLLRALARTPGRERFHLLLTSWGKSYAPALELLRACGLESQVTLLNGVVSKPLLYELHAAVDLVVDQFVWSTYGSSAIEAMSVGAPVLMHIDDEAFRARGWWPPPPVLNARDEEGILARLTEVAAGDVDLEQAGAACARWLDAAHGAARVIPTLREQLARLLG